MKIFALIAIGLMSASALGQNATHSGSYTSSSDAVDGGCRIPNPPAVGDCWECFQDLLEDCDSGNPEGARRQACYEAANNFFTWCLGRVSDRYRQARLGANTEINREREYDVHDGLEFEMFIPSGTQIEDIVLSVRYFDGEQNKQTRLMDSEFFVFDETGIDDMVVIFVDTNIDFSASNSVGVVAGIEQNNAISYAFAFGADVVDSFDVNNDGRFDKLDRTTAMLMYSRGEIDHALLTRILAR